MTDKHRLAEQLQADLADIPDLYTSAWWFLAGSRCGDRSPIGGPSGSRPPVDLAVLDLLDEREKRDSPPTRLPTAKFGGGAEFDRVAGARRQGVLPTLSAWVRDVDSERWDDGDEHQNPPTQRTVPGECGWLSDSLDWIVEQAWLPDIAADVHRIRGDLRAVTKDHDPTEKLTCTECGWAVVESTVINGYRCTGCGHTRTKVELHKLAERKRPRPLRECGKVLDVPHRTLRYLVDKRKLRHVARDGNANLYDLSDAAAAVAQLKIGQQLEAVAR